MKWFYIVFILVVTSCGLDPFEMKNKGEIQSILAKTDSLIQTSKVFSPTFSKEILEFTSNFGGVDEEEVALAKALHENIKAYVEIDELKMSPSLKDKRKEQLIENIQEIID